MFSFLINTDEGGDEVSTTNFQSPALDGLLADCLSCAVDEVPHSAGREGGGFASGVDYRARRRQAWLSKGFPTEHMDA